MKYIASVLLYAVTPLMGATQQATPQPSTQQTPANQMPNCGSLTAKEQAFANQLTDSTNKLLFCNHFSTEQRTQAMQMMTPNGSTASAMTADEAVQAVVKTMPANPRKPTTGGACPVQ